MCAQSGYPGQIKSAPVLVMICLLLQAMTLNSFAGEDNQPVNRDTINNQQLQKFIDSAVAEHGLDRDFITQTLTKAQKNPTVLNAISRPWEAKPWHKYHPIFLTEKRLKKGLEFWQKHQTALESAEQELGVPAHIIVAIIGVESFYGAYKGKYSVLDSLYSLGFFYPPRATFFKQELAQYLKLVQEENWDPVQQKGSYAGAMGWGQFISSSYRHYAIDFDDDGKRDLLNNPMDAIGSVANYFRAHKWRPGEPVAFKAKANSDSQPLLNNDLKLKHTWQELRKNGVSLEDQDITLENDKAAKLLVLDNADNEEYWVVLHNFYVITRYNHSPLYAMVVFQLSESLKNAMGTL